MAGKPAGETDLGVPRAPGGGRRQRCDLGNAQDRRYAGCWLAVARVGTAARSAAPFAVPMLDPRECGLKVMAKRQIRRLRWFLVVSASG